MPSLCNIKSPELEKTEEENWWMAWVNNKTQAKCGIRIFTWKYNEVYSVNLKGEGRTGKQQ